MRLQGLRRTSMRSNWGLTKQFDKCSEAACRVGEVELVERLDVWSLKQVDEVALQRPRNFCKPHPLPLESLERTLV